jgi:hypothetical protein
MADQFSGAEDSGEAVDRLTPQGELPDSLREQLQAAWSKREPKWYERLAPAQRHWVDKLVALRLAEFTEHLAALDREDSQLAHQVAELSAQLADMGRRLAALESRLDQNGPGDQAERPE